MTGKIRQRFCAASGLSSHMIEFWGAGGWSHEANFLADGRIIDARDDDPCGNGRGVQIRPGDYLDEVERWMDVEIACTPGQASYWENLLLSQRLKPYDSLGILDFLTGSGDDRNWRSEGAWFCSELGVWAMEGARICPRLTTPVYKITPGAAALISLALGGKIIASKGL